MRIHAAVAIAVADGNIVAISIGVRGRSDRTGGNGIDGITLITSQVHTGVWLFNPVNWMDTRAEFAGDAVIFCGHQPGDGSAVLLGVVLHEHILVAEYDFFIAVVVEKGGQIGAQAFQNVHQRAQRRRGQIPLQQRNEALGKLAAIRQLFLSQAALQAQSRDLLSDFHFIAPFFSHRV